MCDDRVVQPIVDRFVSARRDPRLAVLHGFHTVKHAVRFEAALVEAVAPDRDAVVRLAAQLGPDVADAVADLVAEVSPDLFARITPEHPDALVAAIALRPQTEIGDVARSEGRVVFLDRPNHLGNIGAVVRVAAAAGASAVVTTGDRDPWHPAALRGSAGLHFAIPVIRTERLPDLDRCIVALDPDGEPLSAGSVPDRSVVAFGSERRGLSPAVRDAADRIVAIRMRTGVSSLNLATAVAVALYS